MSGEDKVAGHIGPGDYDALDPTRDLARWERAVEGILRAAEPELERRARRGRRSVVEVLYRWRRGGVLASGLVAAAASVALLLGGQPDVAVQEGIVYPAEAMVPEMGDWLTTGEAPTMVALFSEFGAGS